MTATVRSETRRTLVFGHSVEASEVKGFIAEVPDEARVTITKYDGDAREPTETTIQASWEA